MSDEEIMSLIREAITSVLPENDQRKVRIDKIEWSSSLSSLGVDSLGAIEAAAHIEDKLGVEFSDDQLSRVVSVADLGELIRKAAQPV